MSTLFATWLAGAMQSHGMDQRRLALALDVKEGTVHGWLKQGAIPTVKNIVQLARFFNVGTDTLIDIAGYDVVPSKDPEERERRRADILARLPRFAEIAERVARMPAAKQDAYLSMIEKMVPDEE